MARDQERLENNTVIGAYKTAETIMSRSAAMPAAKRFKDLISGFQRRIRRTDRPLRCPGGSLRLKARETE